MADERTQIMKLEAMARQTVSPKEAKIAQAFLAQRRRNEETRSPLTAAAILATADRDKVDQRVVSILFPEGWMKFAYDDVPWDEVREYHLKVRV